MASSTAHPSATDDASARFLDFVRHGEPAALERVLAEHRDRAFTQARRLLGDGADAEDAVQEAFLRLVRTARRYDGSVSFTAWLGRLVHDAAIDVRRARGRRRRHQDPMVPETISAADVPAEDVHAEAVRAAVAELPERYRAPLDLHYFAGLSQQDCAAALGLSVGAVGVRLHRARERLRRRLQRRGTAIGTAVVVAALTTAPAHAAPASVVSASAMLVSAVASGAALPATSVPTSLIQHGLTVMNAHPFLAVGLALILAVGGAVALAPARADDAHARPVVAVAPPHPAPAGDQAPHAAKPEYFAGRAGELLRYLAAGDVVQVAADGEALRRLGATTKPTSVIADPAYAPVFQRVLARWPADSDSRLLMENVGLIWSTTYGPDDVADPMCIWMPDRAAFFADKVRQDDPDGHRTIGGFEGGEKGLQFLGVSDGTFILTRCADRLSPRLVRRPQADQAELRTAPLWLRVDAGAFLARARDADVAEADPLGIGRWLPEWREVRPLLTAAVTPEADGWRGTATLSGIRSQPLRHVDAAFAQMISGTPLAGVAVAVDMGWLRRALAGFDGASRDAFGCGIDDVLSLVSGDAVMVAEAGSPFPSLSLILGTRDDPGCAATLQRVLQRIGATSNGDRRWSMMTPIGALTFVADHSRLVITTGGDPQRWLGVPSGRSSDDHGLIMTADLPMLVRTYWPMVVALLPDAPDSSNLLFDRTTVPDATTLARHCPPYRLTVTPRADGLTVEECGLPACVVVGGFLLIFEMQNADPRYLIERATDARTEHQVRDEHARALAVMAHVAEILRDHYADEPPTCLSQLVVDGRLTLAELAPLCGGVTPTDNATVDAIGAWYPDTCGWTVRLSGCWKATIRLRTGDLVVVSTSWCDPTMPTAAQRRGPVKRDAPKDGNGF